MEKDKQQTRRVEAKLKQGAHASPLGEAHLSEERSHSRALRDWLRCPQTEEVSEMIWHAEELDTDLLLGGHMCIAPQALRP
jgi:hypothetical protein